MKKTLILSLFLTLLLTFSDNYLRADFGIKAGVTYSFAGKDSPISNASDRSAAKVGLFYSFSISKSLSIQPEIYYAIKGTKYTPHRREDENVSLNYLEIPVLLNIHAAKNGVDFFIGPYIGFLVSHTEISLRQDWTKSGNKIYNVDFGISVGARLYFIRFLPLEIQFNNGFTRVIYDQNPFRKEYDKLHKNKTLSLIVNFIF